MKRILIIEDDSFVANIQSRAQSALNGGNDLIAKPFLFTELAVKALCFLPRSLA